MNTQTLAMVTELIEAAREDKIPTLPNNFRMPKTRLDKAYEKLMFHIDYTERRSNEYSKLRELLKEMMQ